MELRPGERVDDLGRAGLRIIQHSGRFPFALDAVLLAHFVRLRRGQKVLDLGTGGGVIPLLLSALHEDVHITGLELQPDTADMAARSVELNRLQSRIRIDCGDYRQMVGLYGHERFDVVTMNPPYRETNRGQVSLAHGRATARHEMAGSLGEAMKAASLAVRYGGRVAVVFLAERLADLIGHARERRLEPKRLRLIHPRAGRSAKLLLLEAVKGGGTGLTVEPPLVVYEQSQSFTDELRRLYGI